MAERKTLLTTSELAGLFEVDLKTIYNWMDKKGMPGTRTPGGHRRFEPAAVKAYCEERGAGVPAALAAYVAGASS